MTSQRVVTVLLVFVFTFNCAQTLHPEPRIEGNNSAKQSKSSILFKPEKFGNNNNKLNNDYEFGENVVNGNSNNIDAREPEVDRIQVSDTSKMLLQTSLRFALAQSGVTKYMDLETAVDVVNDTGFMLSKPSTLAKAIRVAVIALATIMTSAFFFPTTYKFIDATIRDPTKTASRLEKYLSNGLYDKSILNLLGARVDELLARVGMGESSCQENTVCQSAKALRCTFPQSTSGLAKLVAEHYMRPKYRQNRFVNSFYAGFVDRNCTTEARNTKQNCIGNLLFGYLFPSDECFNGMNSRSGF